MWDEKNFQAWLVATYASFRTSGNPEVLSRAFDQLAQEWHFHYEPIWYYKNSVISGYGLYGDLKSKKSFQGQ